MNLMILPEFAEGIHYRKLRGGKYRFQLLKDVSLKLSQLDAHTHKVSFRDHRGTEWARIDGDTLVIRKYYSWNGCSPCCWVPIIGWVGTPTPYPVILASLVHDSLFQFCFTQHFPITVDQCNDVFYDIMKANQFRWSNTYFGAVVDFGWFFVGKTPGGGDHSFLIS